jgi:hypothetical protein
MFSPVANVQARSSFRAVAGAICVSAEYRVPSSVPL